MYLFVLVLNRVELLEEILERLLRAGIPGATIIDSTGMGRTLVQADHDARSWRACARFFNTVVPKTRPYFRWLRRKRSWRKPGR